MEKVFEIIVYDERGAGTRLPKMTFSELQKIMALGVCRAGLVDCKVCPDYQEPICKNLLELNEIRAELAINAICSAGSSNGVCDSKNQKSEQQNGK